MKRFTATEKWKDPWFRQLPPDLKCFWLYLCDDCDNAGVWDPDKDLASFLVGATLDLGRALEAFKGRVNVLKCGKWHLIKFVEFQQGGPLSTVNPAHKGITRLLERHGISFEQSPYQAPTEGLPRTTSTSTGTVKVEVQVKGGVEENRVLETTCKTDLGSFDCLKGLLEDLYNRPRKGIVWPPEEEFLLMQIIKSGNWKEEFDELKRFKKDRYFPQSISKLLPKWQETLDRSRNVKSDSPMAISSKDLSSMAVYAKKL